MPVYPDHSFLYPYPVRVAHLSNGARMAYIDQGKGPHTLLLVHGLGSYLKGWLKNIEALRHDFRCIAVDLPGYGKSGPHDSPFSMRFFAECLRLLVRHLELRKCWLVGHSMGGQISLTAALQSQEGLEGLILVAPAGFETFTEPEKQWLRNLYAPALLQAMPVDQIRQNFEINFSRFPDDARFMIDDRLRLREQQAAYQAYSRMIPQCVSAMLEEPVFSRLPSITLPTLILFGEADRLIPNKLIHPTLSTRQIAESGARQLPRGHLHLLPDCGHFAQWEGAAEVNKKIREFVEGR